jgi:DNA mismatch endonuclease, patch repair protein
MNKKSGGQAEKAIRSGLWRKGFRYRLHMKDLPGTPDIVFTQEQVVVFIDGDFWHGKDWPVRQARLALSKNAEYWIAKINYNMNRDVEATQALREAGWLVLRIWESEALSDPEAIVQDIITLLLSRRGRL